MKLILILLALLTPTVGSALSQEIECLAENIYFEARSESSEGQIAVAFVTLNRVVDDRFPDSICDVVKQRRFINEQYSCQFSWFCDGKSDEPTNSEAYEQAVQVAIIAILWFSAGEDFTDGAMFYHADYVSPGWANRLERTVTIETHVFYR